MPGLKRAWRDVEDEPRARPTIWPSIFAAVLLSIERLIALGFILIAWSLSPILGTLGTLCCLWWLWATRSA